jgi:hypothetical protein
MTSESVSYITKCARCGKTLHRAHWHGGKPYGSDCIRLFAVSRTGRTMRVHSATDHDGQLELLGELREAVEDHLMFGEVGDI